MLNLSLKDELLSFLEPFVTFFKDVWGDIRTFFLQFMSEDVFNIFVFGLLIAAIMLIALAIINHD